jgi:hypothetical protein
MTDWTLAISLAVCVLWVLSLWHMILTDERLNDLERKQKDDGAP